MSVLFFVMNEVVVELSFLDGTQSWSTSTRPEEKKSK